MNGLDFKRASDLFLGSEKELGMALGIDEAEVRKYRKDPKRAPADMLARLGKVLAERGRGMMRVGEMLQE